MRNNFNNIDNCNIFIIQLLIVRKRYRSTYIIFQSFLIIRIKNMIHFIVTIYTALPTKRVIQWQSSTNTDKTQKSLDRGKKKMCGCVNSRRRGATNVLKFGHTTAGTWPGTSGWAGVRPICCISAFFRAKWLRPFIKSWSFRCCGGWKYLHGGFSRLHRP